MRARQSRPRRNKAITMMLEDREYKAVEEAAVGSDLGPYCRRVVMAQLADQIGKSEQLILAEICATRRQTEELLRLISDLTDSDIDHARTDADRLRPALVRERILELREAQEAPALA